MIKKYYIVANKDNYLQIEEYLLNNGYVWAGDIEPKKYIYTRFYTDVVYYLEGNQISNSKSENLLMFFKGYTEIKANKLLRKYKIKQLL